MAAIDSTAPPAAQRPRNPADALIGMALYNGWTVAERRRWHELARSAVPADAVEAWKREQLTRPLPGYCGDCGDRGRPGGEPCAFCGAGAP